MTDDDLAELQRLARKIRDDMHYVPPEAWDAAIVMKVIGALVRAWEMGHVAAGYEIKQ